MNHTLTRVLDQGLGTETHVAALAAISGQVMPFKKIRLTRLFDSTAIPTTLSIRY